MAAKWKEVRGVRMEKKRIVVASTGASAAPLLLACLKIIRQAQGYESLLVLSDNAELTLKHETGLSREEISQYADYVFENHEIGAPIASGSFQTAGMLIVPCSMKSVAGICSGYADNLILRAADVTIKEQRTLVLAARETPLSSIHLRNLYQLSRIPGVRIIPPMLTFYQEPKCMEDMINHIAAKLTEPFGIEAKEYRRWKGL